MKTLIQKNRSLFISTIVFLFLNVVLYLAVSRYNSLVPFNNQNYVNSSHHFLPDPRATGGSFHLLNALGQFDAQWYLKIASAGYPRNPVAQLLSNKQEMGSLRYAFYPLYPITIATVNLLIQNIEVSAFLLSNILMLANFLSLYYVIAKTYNKQLATKATFLLMLFPFSVFFRSYFAEGLFLLFLVWFGYYLVKRKLLLAAIFLCLLNVTKANGMLLNFLFLFTVFQEFRQKKISLLKALIALGVVGAAYSAWAAYVFSQTGDPFYFYSVLKAWYPIPLSPPPPLYNLILLIVGSHMPIMHTVHFSQIDMASVIVGLILIIFSKKFLKKEWWWISVLLWILPLVTRDLASFSRYQTVSFPLFVYLTHTLKNKIAYAAVAVTFFLGLLAVLLLFVNWVWIG